MLHARYYRTPHSALATSLNNEGGGSIPPGWLLDQLAEQTLTGGYTAANVLCEVCNTKKSITGACWC